MTPKEAEEARRFAFDIAMSEIEELHKKLSKRIRISTVLTFFLVGALVMNWYANYVFFEEVAQCRVDAKKGDGN